MGFLNNPKEFIKHFVIANVATLIYTALILLKFFINFVKNPFADPWAQKLRLEPPSCLSDPKYGAHKYIIANNLKLHYVESGNPSNPLMIFVHGFPEFWYSWRYQIEEFNKKYWCIAVDMRGYCDSEKPENTSDYDLKLLTDDIRDLVRKLGREKCILVAHDWGSIIACNYRDKYPDALDAIIILGGTSRESWYDHVWSDTKQFIISSYVFSFRFPWVPEKLLQMNDLNVLDDAMLVKGKDTVTKDDLECYKYWFGKPMALTPLINYYRANFSYTLDSSKRAPCKLRVPFLAINAKNDKYLKPALLERLKGYYEHVETIVLENCGHFLQQEEPHRVNKHIHEFLAKNNL